jgi:DNA-binding response OmpR family regulator
MRILLIEDDRRLSASIVKHLKAEGYAIDTAFDGVTGEEYACVNDYDVILLDVLLPRQNGWVTCEHIRTAGILTPILMLTALDQVQDKIRGLDNGADDYLAKPFHAGELLARIRSLARRRTQVRSAVIDLFGIVLDTATHSVRRDGRSIALSAKEFALLELFMMHPRVLVTRQMIGEHVWDMNFDPHSNVIEAFVRLLRKKIDSTFPVKLIHTLRGAGYMFTNEDPGR